MRRRGEMTRKNAHRLLYDTDHWGWALMVDRLGPSSIRELGEQGVPGCNAWVVSRTAKLTERKSLTFCGPAGAGPARIDNLKEEVK